MHCVTRGRWGARTRRRAAPPSTNQMGVKIHQLGGSPAGWSTPSARRGCGPLATSTTAAGPVTAARYWDVDASDANWGVTQPGQSLITGIQDAVAYPRREGYGLDEVARRSDVRAGPTPGDHRLAHAMEVEIRSVFDESVAEAGPVKRLGSRTSGRRSPVSAFVLDYYAALRSGFPAANRICAPSSCTPGAAVVIDSVSCRSQKTQGRLNGTNSDSHPGFLRGGRTNRYS